MKKKTWWSQVSNLCLLLTYKVICYNLSVTTYHGNTTSTTTINSEDIAKQWRWKKKPITSYTHLAPTTSNTTTAIAPHVPSPLLITKTPVSVKPLESSEEKQEQEQEEEEEEDREELEESQKIFDPEEWDEEEDTTVTSK